MTGAIEPHFANGATVWPIASALLADPPEPQIVIPGDAFKGWSAPISTRTLIADQTAELSVSAPEPLAVRPAAKERVRRSWISTVGLSLILHSAALASMVWLGEITEEPTLIAGSEADVIALSGNANIDQTSAGDLDATHVTLIPMLEAKPVETVTADEVPVSEATGPVETVVAEAPSMEVAEPVAKADLAPEVQPSPAAPAMEESAKEIAQPDPLPEILATDQAEPVEDDNIVQPPTASVKPEVVEPVEQAVAMETTDEVSEALTPTPDQHLVPKKPKEKATAKPGKVERAAEKKPQKEKQTKAEAKAQKSPAKSKDNAKAATAMGNGGVGQADTKRGATEGRADGTAASRGTGARRTQGDGNAAADNYKGKVRRKLQRALRAPAGASRQKAWPEVVLSFTISASGNIAGPGLIIRSSGSPAFDKAALAALRRAAPFPPIPLEIGRSSWPFTIPVEFR